MQALWTTVARLSVLLSISARSRPLSLPLQQYLRLSGLLLQIKAADGVVTHRRSEKEKTVGEGDIQLLACVSHVGQQRRP